MPLVFLPDRECLFLWGESSLARLLPELALAGAPAEAELLVPEGRKSVSGQELGLDEAPGRLALTPAASVAALPASLGCYVLASKLAIELVAREHVVPTIVRRAGRIEARWAAALSASEDTARFAALARSMPPAAHAVPIADGSTTEGWAKEALLRTYIDAVVDKLVRASAGEPTLTKPSLRASKSGAEEPRRWEERWQAALTGARADFAASGFGERTVLDELERWSEPAVGAQDRLRACFRLELPEADGAAFTLRFLLQSPDDPSLLVLASEVWSTAGRSFSKFGRAFRDPQESLLAALGRAARLFPPLQGALASATPELIELDPASAWRFLQEGAPALSEAGFAVIVPSELTRAGQRRLRLRMRVGGKSKVAGAVGGSAGLGLDELLAVNWEAIIGDEALSLAELRALAQQKAPLVRYRGAWVAIDLNEIGDIQRRIAAGSAQIPLREAVRAALAGETRAGELSVAVAASDSFAELLAKLRSAGSQERAAPAALQATLRAYQARGLAWLDTMASLGLGACLADDMGLGKTVQLIAFVLRHLETSPDDARPALLIAPTSVVGNWERELARFAPSLDVVPHYGAARLRSVQEFPKRPGTLILTSYGLLRRDGPLLAELDCWLVALDEAQNIKNSASATAQAARALRGQQRFALTGTPVENRLAELWSVLEFANPGLLGPLSTFRRDYAIPIERYGNQEAAERLRRVVSPFVLRRVKSDPSIIADLPAKNEMKVICTLTREQATLYKAVVDEEMRRIESSDGIERRGRVLALLTFLKQICNHPVQYLADGGALPNRSGKLTRLAEMLEEAVLAGDRALVFTQFREMGAKLEEYLAAQLGVEVAFLHGGTSKRARDEMVRRFQEDALGPRIFILSLKAGGTGLNLTAASHVFHYDRWWNPAVEDQATDRAYRIGQKRAVQVHKLLCAGTVEEKVDRLLEQKRELAAKVVAGGERWITELDDGALRELFALSKDVVVAGEEPEQAAPGAHPEKRKRRGSAQARGANA